MVGGLKRMVTCQQLEPHFSAIDTEVLRFHEVPIWGKVSLEPFNILGLGNRSCSTSKRLSLNGYRHPGP